MFIVANGKFGLMLCCRIYQSTQNFMLNMPMTFPESS